MRIFVILICMLLFGATSALANEYEKAVASWTSHQDVSRWLKENFEFSKSRQKVIQKRLKAQGPSGLLIREPGTLFSTKSGYCADSANFALDALNRISPDHNPRWVFVDNAVKGKANHWVTGFNVDGKLYIMDYGAGHNWGKMNGVHGPYDSLDDYRTFLSSLNIKGFKVKGVRWREMPGAVD